MNHAKIQFWHDPLWPELETRSAHNSHACYRMHSHRSHSFGCVDAGNTVLSFAHGHTLVLQAGDVLWLPAQLAHCCNPPLQQHWAYQMMYLAASLTEHVATHAHQVLVWRNPSAYQRFSELHQALLSTQTLASKQALLHTVLQDFLTNTHYPALWQHTPAATHADARLLALLHHPDFLHWSVAQMAQHLHMSRYHFMHWFRALTGWSAHAYQVNARIEKARVSLRTGAAIAHLAHDLGFADQSHFQRVFKAHTAATPKQYQ